MTSARRAARAARSSRSAAAAGDVPLELYDRIADRWWNGLGNRLPTGPRLVSDVMTANRRRHEAIAEYCDPRGLVDQHGNPRLPPRPRATR